MKILKQAVLCIAVSVFLLIFSEGASSLLLFVRKLAQPLPQATVQFDSEIGWAGKPNLYFKDYYGADTFVQTNSLGFLAQHEFNLLPPPGKIRVVCSGNSFPAGDGVGNGKNWCDRLAQHANVEQLNLAQSGYSIDQSFLTFKRHASRFKHSAHIVSFTGQDFDYLIRDNYSGKQKPLYSLKDGKLLRANYPLTQNETSSRKINYHITAGAFSSLNISQLLLGLTERFKPKRAPQPIDDSQSTDELSGLPVAFHFFHEFLSDAKANQSELILVYQPTYFDVYVGRHRALRNELAIRSKKEKLPFYDLTEDLREFSVREMVEGGNGHYMPQVHDRIAQLLVRKLNLH